MRNWLTLLTVAYHSDRWRPIIGSLLIATGFMLATTIAPFAF
jgi:hypothetical protein